MGTKNNPGEYDCYANAEPDEPMFVLLGRDKHAPTLVWLWATLRELDGEDMSKVREARDCVEAMMAWQKDHDRKVAGLGAAALAGVMELVRACNALVLAGNAKIPPGTTDDMLRIFLGQTNFEKDY